MTATSKRRITLPFIVLPPPRDRARRQPPCLPTPHRLLVCNESLVCATTKLKTRPRRAGRDVPILFVRRGPRPSGITPPGTLTRFTWTLGSERATARKLHCSPRAASGPRLIGRPCIAPEQRE